MLGETSREETTSEETNEQTNPEASPESIAPLSAPSQSLVRKGQPIALGVMAYFPRTLAALAECSRIGNDKHCPGEPLRWDRDASTDDADASARHLVDAVSQGPLVLNDDRVPHVVAFAWRALAFAERALTGDDRWRRPGLAARVSDTLRVNAPHSRAFFEQMRTCREAYERLALAFAAVLADAQMILDLGCGTGAQTAALARLGFPIVGVDPLVEPDQVEAGFLFISDDPIRDEIDVDDIFDAVICTEVAEHVYPERADALVDCVCRRARMRVIWSAARPGQEWEGHVNCQAPGYWLAKFSARGFAVNDDVTALLRLMMIQHTAQHCGATENFFVLDRAAGGAPA